MKRRRSNGGFTVRELLAVCVIVFFLALLFVPELFYHNHGREKARRVQCLHNLKQVGLAFAQYSPDFNDRLPYGAPSVLGNMALASNYLGSARVLCCPSSFKKPVGDYGDPQASDATNVSYTYQISITNHTSMIWQTNAEDVVMWDQSIAGNAYGANGASGLPWTPTSNHKGAGGNVLFDDGHVTWCTKTPTNMPLGCLNP